TRTAPWWVGSAQEIEVRGAEALDGVRLHVVEERGQVRFAPEPAGTAQAWAAYPEIRLRSSWGARGPKLVPILAPSLKIAFIHHTATATDYAPEEVPSILRSIQAYHMDSNMWNDIAYNFLVDRFGRLWEGREGGTDKPVVGAHAQGFNTGSTGIAVIGNFQEARPPQAVLAALDRLIGWKLPRHGLDPLSETTIISGGSNRFPKSTPVRLPAVSAHRDVAITACPGGFLYPLVDGTRLRGAVLGAWATPYPGFGGGIFVAAGDLDGDGIDEVVTGPGEGGGPEVRTYSADGPLRSSFLAYGQAFSGGVRVATARLHPDGPTQIITGAGPGGGPHVRGFLADATPTLSFFPHDPGIPGGVYVASGDLDGVPGDEIVTGAGAGPPEVQIFRPEGAGLARFGGFAAYSPDFRGGVRVAAGNLDGSGPYEIVTGPGPGGPPSVRVWELTLHGYVVVREFLAYDPGFTGGIYVSVVRLADGKEAIVTGAGEGGGPHVRVFRPDGALLSEFNFIRPQVVNGVRLAGGQFGREEEEQLALAGGPLSAPVVRLQRLDGTLAP
ncbi:MAG: peptidoglycan recognition protein family protein, partial [Actinomycetota bacterium]